MHIYARAWYVCVAQPISFFFLFFNRVAVSREADLLEQVWMTNKSEEHEGRADEEGRRPLFRTFASASLCKTHRTFSPVGRASGSHRACSAE
jgi:hypothetical protein